MEETMTERKSKIIYTIGAQNNSDVWTNWIIIIILACQEQHWFQLMPILIN